MRKFLTFFCLIALVGCQTPRLVESSTGLQSQVLKKGAGPKAQAGDVVLLFETTTYRDGTVLYSNEGAERPIRITLGAEQVTEAVEEGLNGMRSGEVKLIVAPPNLVKRLFYPDNVSPDSSLVIKLIVAEVIKEGE
jgi:FKBP-type peptidyl-prolyl cis-trans isomerase